MVIISEMRIEDHTLIPHTACINVQLLLRKGEIKEYELFHRGHLVAGQTVASDCQATGSYATFHTRHNVAVRHSLCLTSGSPHHHLGY
jgi:hypothetical protein